MYLQSLDVRCRRCSLWQPLYLHWLDVLCCRCSFGDQRICDLLFFELADAFQPAYHVNCICILPFLGFEDTSFSNFASAFHIFDNVRMLLIEIVHPQLALPMTCRCLLQKLCIFNPWKSTIADVNAHLKEVGVFSTEINSTKRGQRLSSKVLLFCSFDLRSRTEKKY